MIDRYEIDGMHERNLDQKSYVVCFENRKNQIDQDRFIPIAYKIGNCFDLFLLYTVLFLICLSGRTQQIINILTNKLMRSKDRVNY